MKGESGRGRERQRKRSAHVKADAADETPHTCSLYVSQRRLDREPMRHRLLPPSSLLFCSISFITVSWLRNQAVVRVLDHEGRQRFYCGFVLFKGLPISASWLVRRSCSHEDKAS